MWKLVLRAALAVSSSPAVREWVARKALRAIDRTHAKSGKQVKELQKTVAAARLSG
jgi:hypothetical protein